MSCILRYIGEHLDVDALLACTSLKPDRVWRRGEPRSPSSPEGKTMEDSGVTFVASLAGMQEFRTQLADATRFLEDQAVEIRRMACFEGVEHAVLDFGVALRSVMIHSDRLSPRFLAAAAAAGIWVELSHYPRREDAARGAG